MLNRAITEVLADYREYKRSNDESILERLTDELWYDWFCRETSLKNKSKTLLSRLSSVVKANANKKFDPDKCYVFFKNNCPCCGSLYDDFRICDKETGDVIFTISPKLGYDSDYGLSEVFKVGEDDPYVVKGEWKEVINYFKN